MPIDLTDDQTPIDLTEHQTPINLTQDQDNTNLIQPQAKKANITRADKIRRPHRAIKDIKYAKNLEQSVDT